MWGPDRHRNHPPGQALGPKCVDDVVLKLVGKLDSPDDEEQRTGIAALVQVTPPPSPRPSSGPPPPNAGECPLGGRGSRWAPIVPAGGERHLAEYEQT